MFFRSLAVVLVACFLATSCATTPTVVPTEAAIAVSSTMGREEAIARLAAETFLPVEKAACVVDEVFQEAGVYNLRSEEALASVDQAELVEGCTEVDEEFVAPERADDAPVVEIEELEVETGELDIAEQFELTEDTMPVINPGGSATGTVRIGGKNIDYVTITPRGFRIGDVAPVFFALPPGGQGIDITRDVATGVYMNQAVTRGWVVVTPASPGGRWYDNDNTAVVPEFISWINAWVTIEGGRPHIGGMSNGGLSAFHIALQYPSQFRSLLAFPGFPQTEDDQDALATLADIPVRLWVGGEDADWLTSMETTAQELRTVGGDIELWVLRGESHVLQSTSNGIAFFNELDAAR